MPRVTRKNGGTHALRRCAAAVIATLSVGATAACEGVLEVDLPGNVPESALKNPALASTLVLGAQNDFECALVIYTHSLALWTDELIDASTWAAVGNWTLRRSEPEGASACATEFFRGGGTYGPYGPLQIARGQARNARTLIEGFGTVADKASLLAKAAAYEGYATLLLGEAYCEMRLDPKGSLVKPNEVLRAAEALFAKAMEGAQADILNMARVGRARTLARMGDLPGAKTYAAQVPAGFVLNATFDASPNRRLNWIQVYNRTHLFTSVDFSLRNLTVGGVPDSRVSVTERKDLSPNDGRTTLWFMNKYPNPNSPLPIATWKEAQLIIAEAELAANNPAGAVTAINNVRRAFNLPLYASGDPAAIRIQLLEERRRTLFLESHRMGDLLTYKIPFRASGGRDHKNRSITTNTCLPLPQNEL